MVCQEYGSSCAYPPLRAAPRPPDRGRHRALVPIQPHPLQLPASPSDPYSYSEAEGRYHRLFHEKLAFDLSGYFDSPFWTRLIPQQCHQEPAIRDAVFALSALYKSTISSKTNTPNLARDDEHVAFALVKQSHAIRSLRKALANGEPEMRLALVGSLLFSCFESFYGHWETATQQIYNGLKILKRVNEDGKRNAGLADISLEMGLTFRRLEMQILSFLAMNPMLEHPFDDMMENKINLDMPDQFVTFHEAFAAATNLAVAILRHLRTSARCGNIPTSADLLKHQHQHLQERMSQWNKSYDLVFLGICQNPISREYLGALQLRICMWKCEIMIATSLSHSESIYDNYTPQFLRITHFARHLLRTDQQVREAVAPKLQYGMGVIMALFFTATRCRDGEVRREAIAILREWPCTNGIWHSLQAAEVAEWVVGLEEGGCAGGEKFIPEDGRVQLRSLKVVLEDGGIRVECMQYSGNGGLEPRRANLRWVH
ncbi:putative UPC2 Regulatory involved in control of sterol uptake protein [Rutstroemia sp. NJR-2017a BVV2]|nr:putative UPC2 Regulatory involved in control of sterol uptake protein [Rutstroemia sp. NJR-2017a BVV2]